MNERDWTRVLGWPGYHVYQKEIDEPAKKLKLWVRRKKAGLKLIVVCNLETGEPLWFGKTRKKESLDEFFRDELWPRQRKRIEAACVDMWEPFRLSIEEWR